jgi:hypothetical protein
MIIIVAFLELFAFNVGGPDQLGVVSGDYGPVIYFFSPSTDGASFEEQNQLLFLDELVFFSI